MRQSSILPVPYSLGMPLRDMLRGITAVAEVTEDVLKPAGALLPERVQSAFRSARSAMERAGSRATTPDIDLDDIAAAAAYLHSSRTAQDDTRRFVRVLAHAWQTLLDGQPGTHLVFSETLAAGRLEWLELDRSLAPSARAAAIAADLRVSHVAGRLPGMPFARSAAEQATIDVTLFAALIWLLAEREQEPEDEARLLQLAHALTHALQDEVLAGIADTGALGRRLDDLARQV